MIASPAGDWIIVDDKPRGYTWSDWRANGFRGPPPWRRGYRPLYLAISLVLFFGLLGVFWVAGSGRLS